MRTVLAVALSALMSLLGLAGIGQAQTGVAMQGTLEAVDCQAGTVVLDTANGANTFVMTQDATAVVNSNTIPLCNLQDYEYAGAPATVWLVASNDQFLVSEIQVQGPIAYAPPPPAQTVSPVPIWGVVLGTIIAAGLLYLLVHGPNGDYYRYPYYGWYYHHYYHRAYRPYYGDYPTPTSIVIVTVAQPVVGVALGTVFVNNYEYLLCRDNGGNFYRYPYYGPYRAYYYQPSYRPYSTTSATVNNVTVNNVQVTNINNVYVNAPVRVSDPHWDPPAVRAAVQANHTQTTRSVPQQQWQPASGPQPPARQPQPAYQQPAYQQPQPRQPQPAYQQPAYQQRQPRQPQPAYQQPASGHGNGPNTRTRDPKQDCVRQQNQSCSNDGATTH